MKFVRHFPFFLREQAKSILAVSSRGLFGREPFSPTKDIEDYYSYYETDSVLHSAVDSLVDGAVGRGFDTEVEKDTRAKELVDEFSEANNLDALIPNIGKNMVIAGFLPVETFITSVPDRCVLQLIHPKTVEKLEWNQDGQPETLVQTVGVKSARLPFDKLTWFTYNKMGNDPFGTGLPAAVATLLDYKERAVDKMDKILERYASPKGIWKSRGDIKNVMDAVTSNKAGEDLFLGNLPDEELDKVVEFLDIDPRARFWEYIQYIDQLIYAGLPAPNLFYFKDATEASSRVLLEIVDRNIYAVGRILKREIEAKWFKPLIELNSLKEVPKIKWRQRPAMKDLNLPELIGKGIEKGFISFDEYHELMQNLGVSWQKPIEAMKAEYELRKQAIQQVFKPNGQSPESQPQNESYLVTHLGNRANSQSSGSTSEKTT